MFDFDLFFNAFNEIPLIILIRLHILLNLHQARKGYCLKPSYRCQFVIFCGFLGQEFRAALSPVNTSWRLWGSIRGVCLSESTRGNTWPSVVHIHTHTTRNMLRKNCELKCRILKNIMVTGLVGIDICRLYEHNSIVRTVCININVTCV